MLIYQAAITSVLLVLFLIVLWNLFLFRKKDIPKVSDAELPRVSVLVPARNEEKNIKNCVTSLLEQDYPNYEVIVLNDSSEDGTGDILKSIRQDYPGLKIITGKQLIEGWTGKTYACKQLAEEAKGEWLLFTDADTIHKKSSLKEAMYTALYRNADLLSVIPKNEMATFSEKLIMPMLYFTSFVLLPHYFVDKKGFAKFAMAFGPFMLFRKSSYDKIGGHESVKCSILEDVNISKKIKAAGLQLVVADGQSQCTVRMYRNFKEIWNGFSKNIFAGFNYSAPMLFIIDILYLLLFFLPFLFLVLYLISGFTASPAAVLVTVQVIILYLIRILLSLKYRLGLVSSLLHPLGALLVPVIAFNSWRWIASGEGTKWKGRVYQMPIKH